MNFLRGFSIAMGANIIVFVLSFVNNKLIYLYLPETENGIFFLVLRLALFMSLFMGDWLRMSSMNIGGGDRKLLPVLSANGMWYILASALFLIPATALSYRCPGLALLGVPARYFPVVAVTGVALIARNNWQSILLVCHRMYRYSSVYVIWAGVFLALNILFLAVLGWGLGAVNAALIAASVVSGAWAFSMSATSAGHSFKPSSSLFGRSMRVGARAWVAVVGMFIITNIHAFTIEPFSGKQEAGLVMVAIFSVGYRIQSLFQRVTDVAGTILYSHVVQQNELESARLTMLVTRNIMLISLFFALCAAIGGKPLIVIIASSRYITAYVPILIMLPGIVAVNAGSIINNYYWGRTYPLKIIVAPYVASVLGAVMNYWLIPDYGIKGAALSFSIMSLAWLMYEVVCFSRDTALPITMVLVPRYSDVRVLASRFTGIIRQKLHTKRP